MNIEGLGRAQMEYDLKGPKDDGFMDYFDNLSTDELRELAIEYIGKVRHGHAAITESKDFEEWLRRQRGEDGE